MENRTADLAENAPAPATLGDLAGPWQLASAIHDWQMAWFRCWPSLMFCHVYPPHPHETPGQLEIPDPIEAAGERGLFA